MPTDWGDIIKAAASPWGLAALMVLVVGTLALTLFRDAPPQIRLVCFVMTLAAAGLFIQRVTSQSTAIADATSTTTTALRRNLDPGIEADARARLADTDKRIAGLRQNAATLSSELALARNAGDPTRQAVAQQRLDTVSQQLDQLTDLRNSLRRQLGE